MSANKQLNFNPPLPDGVAVEPLCIPALEDEWALGALRFTSARCNEPQEGGTLAAAIVIAPATGVPARFYSHFAAWLASHGHPTTLFDFRVTGASYPSLADPSAVPKGSNNDSASYTAEQRIECLHAHRGVGWQQFTSRDYPAVLLAAREHAGPASQRDLVVFGSSLGGHCLPAALVKLEDIGKPVDVKRALFTGVASAYFGFWKDPFWQASNFASTIDMGRQLGYGPTEKMGLGRDIPQASLEDWMHSSLKENYMASDPRFSEAFRRYHVPTVALAFSDDILAGSPRMIDTPSRVLGTPTSKETVEEQAYWKGPDVASPDHVGTDAWKRGSPPRDPKRPVNAFTNTRLYLDVVANGWVRGSTPLSGGVKDARPKAIGHVDYVRPGVWGDGTLPSAQVWIMLRAWLAEGVIPSHDDKILGGKGSRRDFGAPGDIAVEAPPTARL